MILWYTSPITFTDKGIIAVTEKCPNLTGLNYSECSKVTNAALEAIVSNLPQLEELWANNCNISVIPDAFGDKLKHLEKLCLCNNNITMLPASIGNLEHLDWLHLRAIDALIRYFRAYKSNR